MQETEKQESELKSIAREIFTRAAGYACGQMPDTVSPDMFKPVAENAFSAAERFMAKKYGRLLNKDLTLWSECIPSGKDGEISVTVDVLDRDKFVSSGKRFCQPFLYRKLGRAAQKNFDIVF